MGGLLEFYEQMLIVSILAGITYLFHSDDFFLVHRPFLQFIAVGAGLTIAVEFVLFFFWTTYLEPAHVLFILFIAVALYSLVAPDHN